MIISVYDILKTNIISRLDPMNISLSIECKPNSSCSGHVTSPLLTIGTLSSGKFVIPKFRILSSGTFIITATHADMLSGSLIIINYNNVKKIIATTPSVIIENVDTEIKVNLFGDDDSIYSLPANVSIFDSSIMSPSLYSLSTTGSASFSL